MQDHSKVSRRFNPNQHLLPCPARCSQLDRQALHISRSLFLEHGLKLPSCGLISTRIQSRYQIVPPHWGGIERRDTIRSACQTRWLHICLKPINELGFIYVVHPSIAGFTRRHDNITRFIDMIDGDILHPFEPFNLGL
jgi:hypothetical protein